MLNNSQNVLVTGGHFNINTISPAEEGLKLLQKHVISGALHNSAERGDSPKCHENTRVAVLEEIMTWVNNSDRQTRVLWMNGPAGAGKTAIAHTITEMCYKGDILVASFFCSRSISGRNEKTFLITTIVSQLIVAIPGMREHVGNALLKDHSLLSRTLEAQLQALIVEPLEMARSEASDIDFLCSLQAKLIILDGLDECGDSGSHQSILQVILAAASQHHLPFSFLIASRPEQKIREAFDESTMDLLTVRLVLDNKYLPDEDIRTFLMSRFRDITQRHPSGTSLPSWPSEHNIERLVQKSSGQFIYASTVIKFIDSHRHWPPDRLKIIFGILPRGKTTPFAEMDALYSLILTAASDNIEKILDIFTVLLFLRTSHIDWKRTVPFLESFLSYRTGEVFMVLSDLHSIISVPSPRQQNMALQFFHASLGDFLADRSRAGEDFFLDPGVSHRKIATWMMKRITGPSGHLGEEFVDHCLKSTPTPEFLSDLGHFDISHVLYATGTMENFVKILDAVHLDNRIPEFLVWLHRQRCPEWRKDNQLHLYVRNVDVWFRLQLVWVVGMHNGSDISDAILATATLVDFPEFRDLHGFIFAFFEPLGAHAIYDPTQYLFNPQQWELYVKYRQLLSEFLTDRGRSGTLFVGTAHYLKLAPSFWSFIVGEPSNPGIFTVQEMKYLKAVMLAFPELLSRCPTSVELAALFKGTQLVDEHWFQRKWPGEDWAPLLYTLSQACDAYCNSVPTNCEPAPADCKPLSTDQKTVLKRWRLNRVLARIKHFLNRN